MYLVYYIKYILLKTNTNEHFKNTNKMFDQCPTCFLRIIMF